MDKIDELLTRGVANIIPSKEKLIDLLKTGKKLNVYMGIDPTAVNIHLGHAVVLRKLQKIADMGHNVIFLVGDFTARIGDTSDKESERPQLTSEEIETNVATYKEQASKILDFSKVTIRFNSEWLKELKFEDIIKLLQHFSLNDFISRELIKKRLAEGKSVGLLETMYPLMQGYDSYMLDTDIQLGGTDQTFNMQAGRTLLKDMKHKESYVIANGFLSGTDGRKMSKTWGNAIWLTDSASDMYGKVMSLKDELIVEYFLLATDVPDSEIKEIEKKVATTPMEEKKKLAYIITAQFHGDAEAEKAQQEFEKVVQHKEKPEDIETLHIKDGIALTQVLVENKIVSTVSEAKRIIEQHGVKIDDVKIDNPFLNTGTINNGALLQVGKRTFYKLEKK